MPGSDSDSATSTQDHWTAQRPLHANTQPVSVGIVGAGFSGLALAQYLRAAGIDVQVYESRRYEPEFHAYFSLPSLPTVWKSIGLSLDQLPLPNPEKSHLYQRQKVLQVLSRNVPIAANTLIDEITIQQLPLPHHSDHYHCQNAAATALVLHDSNGHQHGPFTHIVAANGVRSAFRTCALPNVLLLGDARWVSDQSFYDFGTTRIERGANQALLDAMELGSCIVQMERQRQLLQGREDKIHLLPDEETDLIPSQFLARVKRASILQRRLAVFVLWGIVISLLVNHFQWKDKTGCGVVCTLMQTTSL